jgi:hypothetical protein
MKKLFTLALLALGLSVGSAQAQEKKTWAFQEAGLSPETIADLDADEANWAKEGTNEAGETTGWKEATKHTGTLKANGNEIAELKGITIENSGLSNNNNVIIRKDRVRLNRNNMKFRLPQLVNGQTVTIVCQSANSSATDRGVKASFSYMKRIEGPEDDLILGAAGQVKNVWQIETDDEGPVDVEFTLITGGIDFRLIQIDNGDEAKRAKIAYVYDGNENDQVLNYLKGNELYDVTALNVTTETLNAEALRDYEVTVVGSSVPADNAAAGVLKEALPWTPVLNLNANLYNAWGYGEATAMNGAIVLNAKQLNNALFKDVETISADALTAVFINEEASILGVKLGDYFADDQILASAANDDFSAADNTITAIHTHNIAHNGYVFLPFDQTPTANALQLVANAISTLQNSKREVTPATAPTLSREYKDRATIVTIKAPALPKAQVYYTTDGSEPTTASQLYTEPFTLSAECVVKASAIAEGYTLSQPAELKVTIKSQPATPVISYEMSNGQTTLKFACATEDVKIWYNFSNSVDTVRSAVYADTIPVIITMPQDVTVFATTLKSIPTEVVFSETASQRVLVQNPRVVIDVAGHYGAAAWDGISNGSGLFSGGKKATSMYDTTKEPIGKTVDPETGDETALYPEVDWEIKDEPGENPQWQVMTKGQAVLWQNNGASTDKVGTNEGGYYPTVAEDIDALFPVTKNDIQFAAIASGEPANAAIQSKVAFKGPLDIVVLANMQGGPILAQVSADGENWTTVGEEIAKTGYTRMWAKYVRMYEGTDEVYVRVAQETGSSAAKIFDIYVANQGEKSKALLDELNAELTGIDEVAAKATTAPVGVYSLNGIRRSSVQRGLNIVVGQDGQVRKIMLK